MKITNFSVNKSVTVSMIFAIILVLGGFFYSKLGLDLLPDIKYPTVSVISTYNGVAPEDIEELLTKPIEDAVSTVPDVKSVKSFSQEGLSAVIIEFNWGANVDFAAQDVRDKLGLIENFLPQDANKPMVFKLDVGDMPILVYGVTSDSLDTLQLRDLLKNDIKDKLERVDGVASVQLRGGWEREILVKINKPQLDALGISQNQIVQSLRAENVNVSGGFIDQGLKELSLRTIGEYKSIEEIKNTVLTIRGGVPIYLRDVAEIVDAHKEVRGYSRTNKKDSVLLLINKQSDANTVQVVEKVKEELPKLKKYLPEDAKFFLAMDQSRLIKMATGTVAQSAIIGGLLAALVIFLFLRNWRPTFAIVLAIPISLIATFIPLYTVGYTLNLMTLGGLALGVGMLVDNAVVVIENIYRHLEKGKSRKEAAKIGTNEVGMAITASTLTTIAVFFPMLLGEGIAGQFSKGLTLTIVFTLICSLFVALTLVPMIASKLFKVKEKAKDYKESSGEKYFIKAQNFYKKLLRWSLNNRLKTMLITIMLFIASVGLVPFIGMEFMPPTEQSMMMMQIKMPVGTSLEETNKVVGQLEDVILNKTGKNLESMTSFVGKSEGMGGESVSLGFGGGGTNEAQVMMRLKDKNKRKMSTLDIQEIIRKNTPPIRGLKVKFVDMSTMMMGDANAPIEIKVFGKDQKTLKKIATDIAETITSVKGVRDVDSSLNQEKEELVIKINRETASHLGLTVGQIGLTVRNALQGVIATQFRQSGEETDIQVRYNKVYRNDIENIKNLTIPTALGAQIPLKEIAQVYEGKELIKIEHEDQSRVAIITANTVNRDVGSIVNEIKDKLSTYRLSSGYSIEYGGSYKQMKETFRTLGMALILAILLVYMIMASQFESFVYPFVAMFEIPLAFIGVGLILFFTKQTLSLPSFMGIIMLAGIVVNNAIVLIDYVNQLREKGMNKLDALIEGGVTRLRPILITSLTTLLGMLPMALSRQEGSEMMRPMAIAVIGGLLVATVLTLVVIPVIYSFMEDISRLMTIKINGVINKE
jgi:HAE1 family hydrophobic/amphiphilic exporter-1